MARLSRAHQEAWSCLFASHAHIQLLVDRALDEAGLPPHAWYDLLYRLHLSEEGRKRMHELADQVLMSRSGLTRLADRLEEAGLIARRQCPVDRRGYELELLPAGTEMLRAMWAVYADVLARTFGVAVADPDGLCAQLRPLLDAVGVGGGAPPARRPGQAGGSTAAPA
jgi:DNA-binding MarR family transcriptional regulator